MNIQHPGETTGIKANSPGIFGQEATYTNWWPEGNKTANDNPSTRSPRPWRSPAGGPGTATTIGIGTIATGGAATGAEMSQAQRVG